MSFPIKINVKFFLTRSNLVQLVPRSGFIHFGDGFYYKGYHGFRYFVQTLGGTLFFLDAFSRELHLRDITNSRPLNQRCAGVSCLALRPSSGRIVCTVQLASDIPPLALGELLLISEIRLSHKPIYLRRHCPCV